MSGRYGIGIDLGGTKTAIGAVKADGTRLADRVVPTQSGLGPKNLLTEIAGVVQALIRELGLGAPAGVGLAVAGRADAQGTLSFAPNLGWRNVPLEAMAQETIGSPVCILNDASAALLGEAWLGAARGARNVVMLTLGTGVGGGILTAGKLLLGAHGFAGEVGHMTLDPSGPRCACGRRGCLEALFSGTGLVRRVQDALQAGQKSSLQEGSSFTARDVLSAARSGDPLAKSVVQRGIAALGQALGILSVAIDPAMIVLGGGMSAMGEELIRPLKAVLESEDLGGGSAEIRLAALGNDAGFLGAAWAALEA